MSTTAPADPQHHRHHATVSTAGTAVTADAGHVSPASVTATSTTTASAEDFGQWLTATAGLAASTVRTYTAHVRDYTHWWNSHDDHRPLELADPVDVEAYLAHLTRRGLSAGTRRSALHALRAYYRWLQRPQHTSASHLPGPDTRTDTRADTETRLGDVDATAPSNPAAAVRRPRVPTPRTMIYTEAQADAILAATRRTAGAADTPPTAPCVPAALDPPTPHEPLEAARVLRAELDRAVLATLRWTGLRASELCQLTLADLRLPSPDLHGELHVFGKGAKHRQLPVAAPLAAVLEDYLHRTRPRLHAGRPASDRLFVNPDSPTGALAPRALLDLCRRHGHAASVAGPHHPLRWRHTFATHTLARGASLHTVSRLLGHSRVAVTERYLHLDTGDLAAALNRAYPQR